MGQRHWWAWVLLLAAPAFFAFVLGVLRPLLWNIQAPSKTMDRAVPDGNVTVVGSDSQSPDNLSSLRPKLPTAQKKWQSSGLTSKDYTDAALVIIKNLERDENKWLTIGNVLKALGTPSLAVHNGYTFNQSDGIDPESSRFSIYYLKRQVSVSFSAAGFVDAVLYQERPEQWSGSGLPMHWPQKHTDAGKLPIISTACQEPDPVTPLIIEAEALLSR